MRRSRTGPALEGPAASRERRRQDPPAFEDLAASLAHHIRTPLATTLLYLHLIEGELGPNVTPALKEGLLGAHEEIDRLDRMLGKLLDYQRSGHLLIQPAQVDAGRVVADVVARMVRPADGAGIAIDVSAGDLVDWWDAGALEQILQNLLTNALQHGAPPVSVTAGRIEGLLRVTVRDAGSDVPARGFADSFHRRAAATRERGQPRMGVGLWLVGELVSAHGGTADVEIDREGGTVVTVTLQPLPPAC